MLCYPSPPSPKKMQVVSFTIKKRLKRPYLVKDLLLGIYFRPLIFVFSGKPVTESVTFTSSLHT